MADIKEKANNAFRFDGNWQDFARIAFPNLLLTIVTLGIYRFWATTRERQYLWSHTSFVDERLEWTGEGRELFFGFLIVAVLIGLPFLILQFIASGMIFRGMQDYVLAMGIILFLATWYLSGVARFRAMRYRLSRTRWRGIRGGSDNPGFAYGWSYFWRWIAGILPVGLLIPWTMTSLWNERWREMSFGPYQIESDAEPAPIYKRFLLFYVPLLLLIPIGIGFQNSDLEGGMGAVLAISLIVMVFFIYFGMPLLSVAYYAKFFREAVSTMRWGDVEFSFRARTSDWIVLYLVDFLLISATFGLAYIFIPYRHWKFYVDHMHAEGEIDLDAMTQSQTATARHGEGLLDAFDVGAI